MANVIDLTRDEPSLVVTNHLLIGSNISLPKLVSSIVTWKGLNRGDGRHRLYKSIPSYVPGKIRRKHRRGRLITSFKRNKLIKIAWELMVANPDGFDQSDSDFLNCDRKIGYLHFVTGWKHTKKDNIATYIWNKLHDTDSITTSTAQQ